MKSDYVAAYHEIAVLWLAVGAIVRQCGRISAGIIVFHAVSIDSILSPPWRASSTFYHHTSTHSQTY
jgi:hypothetical protein